MINLILPDILPPPIVPLPEDLDHIESSFYDANHSSVILEKIWNFWRKKNFCGQDPDDNRIIIISVLCPFFHVKHGLDGY